MSLTKEEQKQLIELSAKAEGMPKKEFIAALAKEHGIEITPPTRQDANTRFLDTILKAGSEGKLSMKEMFEAVTNLKMMEMLGGGMTGKQPDATAGQPNIMELLDKNDEKWERRLAQDKQDRKEEALQARLDKLETLIAAGANKKDEHNPVLEEIKETRKELAAEKEKRHEDNLAAKDDKIADLKEYVDTSLAALQNQPQAKDPTEAFFEMMQKMEKFDDTVKRRGKALGMTNEQIEKEVAEATPMKQQIVKDLFKTANRYIDTLAGRKPEPAEEGAPEIAQPEAAQASTMICGSCRKPSTNGTDWCDACRIQYSNDVVAEQQRAAAEAAQKNTPIPHQQTEAEARAKGEIPVEAQPEETQRA